MDIDEFKCSEKGCDETAEVECTCKIKNLYCSVHYKPHKLLNRCKFEYTDEKIEFKKVMMAKNALDFLNTKMIAILLTEVGKTNAFLKDNYNLIGFEKFQIKNLRNNAENPDFITAFSRQYYNNKSKDKTHYIFNAQYLLSITGKFRDKQKS